MDPVFEMCSPCESPDSYSDVQNTSPCAICRRIVDAKHFVSDLLSSIEGYPLGEDSFVTGYPTATTDEGRSTLIQVPRRLAEPVRAASSD